MFGGKCKFIYSQNHDQQSKGRQRFNDIVQKSYKHTSKFGHCIKFLDFYCFTASYKYYNLTLNHTLILTELRMIFTNEDVPKREFWEILSQNMVKYTSKINEM